ncbi:MAG: FISUMP domain-containing protein [Bacteroidota bacterium]
MNTKTLILSYFFTMYGWTLYAQADTLTDHRDGKKYEIILIDSLWWMTQNLRLTTGDSYFPNFNKKKEQLKSGNFYPKKEVGKLCPKGWRIPTGEEWARAIVNVYNADSIITKKVEYNNSDIFQFAPENLVDFTKKNALNIKRYGWVQGNKFNYKGGTTFWLNYAYDPNYHLHFGLDGFSQHTHQHHIEDKPKKQRKFLIRCVCSISNQNDPFINN